MPELKLTPDEKSDIDAILQQYSTLDKTSLPVASGDEVELDQDGNRIYPWSKFEDHQDDAIKIEYYEREHRACIEHIL